jgi:hypothetical protein
MVEFELGMRFAAPGDVAMVKEYDFVGEPLHVKEHVGTEENTNAPGEKEFEEREDDFATGRIEAFEGFIEEQKTRGMEQSEAEGGLLTHAVRCGGGETLAAVVEAEQLEEVAGAPAGFGLVEAVKVEVLLDGESVEEREDFREDAELALPSERSGLGALSEDGKSAGGFGFETGGDFEGRGLAGAIGSDESDGLTGEKRQIQTRKRGEVTETDGEGLAMEER